MKDIYIALWTFKSEREASCSDDFECASFDLDECAKRAKEAWDHQTKREQATRSLSVLRYSYDKSMEDPDNIKNGYDSAAIMWDEGGWGTGHEWGV